MRSFANDALMTAHPRWVEIALIREIVLLLRDGDHKTVSGVNEKIRFISRVSVNS